MKFALIEYLNLLPFAVFLKRSSLQNSFKSGAFYRRGKPAQLNERLRKRAIDAAFVSSAAVRNGRFVSLGIVADGAVRSVLLLPGESREDSASKSSNALAKVLALQGEVVIGDRALFLFHQNGREGIVDLAAEWKKRTGMPFVFALLAYNRGGELWERLAKDFLRAPVKIPHFMLKSYCEKRSLTQEQANEYLKLIGYKVGRRELAAYKKFRGMAKRA